MPSKDIMPPSTSHHNHLHLNQLHIQQQQQQLQNADLQENQQPQQLQQQQQQQQIQKKNDFVSVEELVYEIKENLRLKARPSSHQSGRSRPSPYHIPCRSWNDQQQPQQQQQQSFIINNNSNSLCTECNNLSSNNNSNSINSDISIECQTCKTNRSHQQFNSNNYSHRFRLNQKKDQDIDDPYELLQKLLKSKNLVKEAVRRLQLNNISPKQRSYFYESDEESRSPMFRMCQLEL